MPDSLTLRFKEELDKRGVVATDTEVNQFLSQYGNKVTVPEQKGSLWESVKAGEAPEWYKAAAPEEPDSNMFRALGIAAWSGPDIATLGIAGVAAPGITKWAEPETFGERAASALGGLAGFLVPFGAARAIAGKAVSSLAKQGVSRVSKSMVDDTAKILQGDRAFRQWWKRYATTNKLGPDDFKTFVAGITEYPVAKISMLGTKLGKQAISTTKGRATFVKEFRDNVPKAVNEALGKVKVRKPLTEIKGMGEVEKRISDSILTHVGEVTTGGSKVYKFPMANMHELFAAKLGNGKIANLAAAAAEEAALFTAVEMPMHIIQSMFNEEMEFNPMGTLGHAVMLGSALGMFRFIPGGKGLPIAGSIMRRASKAIGMKKRYSRYNVNEAGDRLALATHLKGMAVQRPDLLKAFRRKVVEPGVGGKPMERLFSTKVDDLGKEIDILASTKKGAAELKDILVTIENTFVKNWWPAFRKEVPGDIFGSVPRMFAIALAFNFPMYLEWMKGAHIPMEDIMFHTALGAVLGKKGKQLSYIVDGKLHTSGKDRPHLYSDDFAKVDEYLNIIQSNPDASIYKMWMNDYQAIRNGWGGIRKDSSDMKIILGIAKKNKIIVEDAEGYERKPAEGKTTDSTDELYDNLAALVSFNFLDPMKKQLVKSSSELTDAEVRKVLKELSEAQFEGLTEFRDGDSKTKGIGSTSDLFNVVLGSSEAEANNVIKLTKRAVVEAYNRILEIEAKQTGQKASILSDIDGEVIDIRRIEVPAVLATGVDHPRVVEFLNNSIDLMVSTGKFRYVKGRNTIKMNTEMLETLFGKRFYDGEGMITVDESGILDKYDDQLTQMILGEDVSQASRKFTLGNSMIHDWMKTVIFRSNVRDTHKALDKIMKGEFEEGMIWGAKGGKAEFDFLQREMKDIFVRNGSLATDIRLVRIEKNKSVPLSADEIKESGMNERVMAFASGILRVLRNDVTSYRISGGFGEKNISEVTPKKIANLMGRFREYNVRGFSLRRPELDTFLDQLSEYTLDKSIGSMRKNDGTFIDVTDRTIIKMLLGSRVLSDTMTIPDIRGTVDDIFARFSVAEKSLTEATKLKTFFDILEAKGHENLPEHVQVFLDAVKQKSKSSGQEPDVYVTELLSKWNSSIAPFIKTPNGGFINVDKRAVIDAGHLAEIVHLIEALNTSKYDTSHSELMHAIKEANFKLGEELSGKAGEYRRFLMNIENMLLGKHGNSHRALQIFKERGIVNERGIFVLDAIFAKEGPKTYDILKALEQELYFNFSATESQSSYERLLEIEISSFNENSESTMGLSTSLNQYIKRNGIGVAAEQGQSLAEVVKATSPTLTEFFVDMRSKANIDYNGVIYSGENGFLKLSRIEGGDAEQLRFWNETLNVFATLKHSREILRLHAVADGAPQHTSEIIKDNKLSRLMDDIGIPFKVVDPHYGIKGRRAVNIMQSLDNTLINDFYKIIAQSDTVGRKGLGDETQQLQDVVAGIENFDFGEVGATGHYVAWLGSFSNGIAIPIKMSSQMATKFVETFRAKKAEWEKAGLDKQEIYKTVIDSFESFIKDNISTIEVEKGQVEYKYKDLTTVGAREASGHMSTMLTTVFGHNVMGKSFWDSVVSDWHSPTDFAGNIMRRIKLATNRQHIPLTKEYVGQVIELLGKSEANYIKDVRKKFLPIIKKLNKQGMSFNVVRDEKVKGEDKNPGIVSVLEQYNLQLAKEKTESAGSIIDGEETLGDIRTEEGAFKFGKEKMEDASVVNSVNIISKDTMEAIKLILGFFHHGGVRHGKPIGMTSSDGNMVMIDKTAFIVDKNWEPYLENNGVNGVMFTSSAKMLGDGYRDRIINLRDEKSLEDFMGAKHEGKAVDFALEDFAFGQFVNNKHDATIALQVGSDLVGENLNNQFYSWLMGGKVEEYLNKTSVFGTGDTYGINALVNASNAHLIDTVEGNQHLAVMDVWAQGGGPSNFFINKRGVNNTIKRMLIDRAGIFSPRNSKGSQSILAPSYYPEGHRNYLRNTIFITNAKTGVREPWTYGQIEIDDINRYKLIDTENIRIIRHKKGAKDEIIEWKDIEGLTAEEQRFEIEGKQQARTLQDIYKFLQKVNKGEEKYELVEKKRRKGYTSDLARVKSQGNLRNIADAIIISRDGKDNKYVVLRDKIDVTDLERRNIIKSDTKGGARVRGRLYKGIRIAVYYYQFTKGRMKGTDIIVVDKISDAKRQFLNYKEGGAKKFTEIQYGSKKLAKEATRPEIKDTYEVAIVAQRMPSTRPSDKVIVGLKGFGLEGNAARINSIDALTRLEADFDLDKINYWWDTPPDILKEWDRISGVVDAVVPKRPAKSVDNLNILKGSSLEKYAFDDQKSALQRGIYVKTRRLMQWLQHYKGSHTDVDGMSFDSISGVGVKGAKLNPRIVLNDKQSIDVTMQTLARDIQSIIDASKGYDDQFYGLDHLDKILFGVKDNADYPGLFVRQVFNRTDPDTGRKDWQNTGEIDIVDRHAIKALLTPYQRLLSLSSGIYETGVKESIDYQTMMDYSKTYRWKMNNLNKWVAWSLQRNIGNKDIATPYDYNLVQKVLDRADYFGGDTLVDKPYGNRANNLLPFEKALNFLTYEDHLLQPPPNRLPAELTRRLENWISPLINVTGEKQVQQSTSNAVREIMLTIRKDVNNLGTLNYLQGRIRNARRAESRSNYLGNVSMANHFRREQVRLKGVTDAISKRIMAIPSVQAKIAKTIAQRMRESIRNGKPTLVTFEDGTKRMVTSMEGVGRKDIFRSIWDYENRKLFVKIIGVPTDDYLQLQAYYETLGNKVALGLNPEGMSREHVQSWDEDISHIRNFQRKVWGEYWRGRAPTGHDAKYISNRIQNEMREHYRKWTEVNEGLGKAFIIATTLPKIDLTQVTYTNGRFGVAFKDGVSGNSKFINSAFKFLVNEAELVDGKSMVMDIAKEFQIVYRAMKDGGIDSGNRDYIGMLKGKINAEEIKSIMNSLSIDTESPTDFTSYLDTVVGGGNEGKPMTSEAIMNVVNVNPDVQQMLGLTGNVALDYIALKQPHATLGLIASLKNLLSMDFIPGAAINNRGRLVRISGLNQFYRLKRRHAKMFLADNGNRNVITGTKVPSVGNVYGASSRPNILNDKKSMVATTENHIEKDNAKQEGVIC